MYPSPSSASMLYLLLYCESCFFTRSSTDRAPPLYSSFCPLGPGGRSRVAQCCTAQLPSVKLEPTDPRLSNISRKVPRRGFHEKQCVWYGMQASNQPSTFHFDITFCRSCWNDGWWHTTGLPTGEFSQRSHGTAGRISQSGCDSWPNASRVAS